MDLPTYFNDFLKNINISNTELEELQAGHANLREMLSKNDRLKEALVSIFLQGSYRRSTLVRPPDGKKADVDVIVVTKLDKSEFDPRAAMDCFIPFLEDAYPGAWRPQGRSFGIALEHVDLDMVITSAPSETELGLLISEALLSDSTLEDSPDQARSVAKAAQSPEWKSGPLEIPDREAGEWQRTHPLEQIRWTSQKNASCNGHYTRTVRALKWWWASSVPSQKRPKGYPIEHIFGAYCPDGITSVAEGVSRTLTSVAEALAGYAEQSRTPFLADHGVPEHNVLARLTGVDFAAFHEHACVAAAVARMALSAESRADSISLWRELFGSEFPGGPDDRGDGGDGNGGPKRGGFTPPEKAATPAGGRYAR